ADRNRSHWSTSKTPSYTKSVSWQHHRPISTATNRSLLVHRYNFVGNSSGNKEFLPEPPGIIR
ncbi:hypothetical protein C9179_20230, partial [Escherichia coli]